jgi:hypothetical protein
MKKKVLFIPLLILLFMLVAGPAAAQSSETTIAVLAAPDGQLTVGDPIELTLSVTHPADSHAIMPELAGEWGPFLVNNQTAPVTQANGDGTESTSQVIDARLFAPGSFTTPPVVIGLTDSAGLISEIIAQPLTVDITSVLVEGDSELRDIKPQAEMPYVNILLWVLAALIMVLLVGVVLLIVRHLKARRALAAMDNRLPHEVALEELDRIEGLQLPDAGLFKEHYTLITDTLRIYMEKRVTVPMMERTTAEIQEGLKQANLEPSIAGHLLSILDVSDLVKFSKFSPEAASAYGMVTSARQIVQATIPVVEEEDTDPPHPAAIGLPSGPEISVNGKNRQTEVNV